MTQYCAHALSRDGDKMLLGQWDGKVALRDRSGKELWTLLMKQPLAAAAWCAEPGLFVGGTWGGVLAAFVERGLEWQHELNGTVASLGASAQGMLAAGTWSGHVCMLRREGELIGEARLPDAVTTLALDPRGSSVYVALADHTLLALEPDGTQRWRRALGARIRHLATSDYEILAMTEDGTLVWFHTDGSEVRRLAVPGGLTRAASSANGATVAWVDAACSLHFWQPRLGRRWDVVLPEAPDVIAVAGPGNEHFCVVILTSGTILIFDRGQICRRQPQPLPGRVQDLRLSATGVEASVLFRSGGQMFQEIDQARACLPPARVRYRLSAGSYVAGRIGTVTVELTNEGSREAQEVAVNIAGEHIRQSAPDVVRSLAPGATRLVRTAFEPLKTGDVPVTISLRWSDERGEFRSESFQEFLSVVQEERT